MSVLSLVYLSHISDVWSQLARIGPYEWIPVCRRVHQDFNRRYTLPLQLASVFAFVKEYLAVIVLGQAASVTQVAYYQVVNRIFVIPRKFILNTMHALLPKIVDAMEANPAHFRKQFRFFAWVQLAFCVAAASAILALQRPIFALLGIEPTAEVAMVVLFFSFNLLFSALSQSNSLGFHFGSDTRAVMVVSILRASILTVLTMLLVPHAQAVGGAIALMVATACSAVMLVIANRRGYSGSFATTFITYWRCYWWRPCGTRVSDEWLSQSRPSRSPCGSSASCRLHIWRRFRTLWMDCPADGLFLSPSYDMILLSSFSGNM